MSIIGEKFPDTFNKDYARAKHMEFMAEKIKQKRIEITKLYEDALVSGHTSINIDLSDLDYDSRKIIAKELLEKFPIVSSSRIGVITKESIPELVLSKKPFLLRLVSMSQEEACLRRHAATGRINVFEVKKEDI